MKRTVAGRTDRAALRAGVRPTKGSERVADTIYTRALARAAERQGSTQGLASALRVPENTLLRWMSGRAQMPLQAFLKLIEMLGQYEKNEAPQASIANAEAPEKLQFKIGDLIAHCARCDGEEFQPAVASERLRYTSALICCACSERVIHGNLIAQLAKDAIWHSRTMTAARARRRMPVVKPSPQALPKAKIRLPDGGAS